VRYCGGREERYSGETGEVKAELGAEEEVVGGKAEEVEEGVVVVVPVPVEERAELGA
jgi:hypothetical protein